MKEKVKNLNTSHVKVKHNTAGKRAPDDSNLNTSHVKVKLNPDSVIVDKEG